MTMAQMFAKQFDRIPQAKGYEDEVEYLDQCALDFFVHRVTCSASKFVREDESNGDANYEVTFEDGSELSVYCIKQVEYPAFVYC